MSDAGGSVTLIFYRIDSVFNEPFLNILAAAAQLSSFTHVELAIGDTAGEFGQMKNVVRVFNDDVGVELAQRTGKNPKYSYLSLGCSKNAENVMLNYAKGLVGRPFSNSGMMRSVIFPRITDDSSFFCAELVAAVLKKGGLMSRSSNPGSATPQSLWQMYKGKAAVTGNPFVLRNFASQHSQKQSVSANPVAFSLPLRKAAPIASSNTATASRRRDSPPRASFKLVSGSGTLTTHNLALLKR